MYIERGRKRERESSVSFTSEFSTRSGNSKRHCRRQNDDSPGRKTRDERFTVEDRDTIEVSVPYWLTNYYDYSPAISDNSQSSNATLFETDRSLQTDIEISQLPYPSTILNQWCDTISLESFTSVPSRPISCNRIRQNTYTLSRNRLRRSTSEEDARWRSLWRPRFWENQNDEMDLASESIDNRSGRLRRVRSNRSMTFPSPEGYHNDPSESDYEEEDYDDCDDDNDVEIWESEYEETLSNFNDNYLTTSIRSNDILRDDDSDFSESDDDSVILEFEPPSEDRCHHSRIGRYSPSRPANDDDEEMDVDVDLDDQIGGFEAMSL